MKNWITDRNWKRRILRLILILLLILAVLLAGFYGYFIGGLAYSRNLNSMESTMHPMDQPNTLWISDDQDLYLINHDGRFSAYVLWQDQWQKAEFLDVGARFQMLWLGEEHLLEGRFSMKREDVFRLQCSDDSESEAAFAKGRRHIILHRYDLHENLNQLPFAYVE